MAEVHLSALRRLWGLFGLDGERPHLMVTTQWQCTHRTTNSFLLYRWGMTLLSLGMVVASIVMHSRDNPPATWLIFFTNWGLLLMAAHYSLAAVIATLAWRREDEKVIVTDKGMPWSYKMSWVVGNVINVVAIGVTIGFWAIVYDPKLYALKVITFITHGVNSIVIIIDFLIGARPCRLAHVIHPVLVFILYVLFSVCYWWAGGVDPKGRHYIYAALDWQRPLRSISAVMGAIVLLMVIHGLLCGICALRLRLARRLNQKKCNQVTSSSCCELAGKQGINQQTFVWTSDIPGELEEEEDGGGVVKKGDSVGFGILVVS